MYTWYWVPGVKPVRVYGLVVAVAVLAPEPPDPMMNPAGPQAICALPVTAVPLTVQPKVADELVVETVTFGTGQGVCVAVKATLSTNRS